MLDQKPMKVGLRLGGEGVHGLQGAERDDGVMELALGSAKQMKFDDLTASACIYLKQGQFELQLGERAIRLHVPENSEGILNVKLEGNKEDDDDSSLKLMGLQCEFLEPLVLANFLTTIDEVRLIFGDDFISGQLKDQISLIGKASEYWRRLSDTQHWKVIRDSAGGVAIRKQLEKSRNFIGKRIERAEEAVDSLIDGVSLTKLELRCYEHIDGALLHIYVSGQILLNNRMKFPFNSIRVPEFLLPKFYADIPKLLSQFCVEGEIGERIMRGILPIFDTFKGHVEGVASLKGPSFLFDTRDNQRVSVNLEGISGIQFNGKLNGKRTGEGNLDVSLEADLSKPHDILVRAEFSTLLTDNQIMECGKVFASENGLTISMLGTAPDLKARLVLNDVCANNIHVSVENTNDLLKGSSKSQFTVEKIWLSGNTVLSMDTRQGIVYCDSFNFDSHGNVFSEPEKTQLDFGKIRICNAGLLDAPYIMKGWTENGEAVFTLQLDGGKHVKAEVEIEPIPELGISEPVIHADLQGMLKLSGQARILKKSEGRYVVTMDGTQVTANVSSIRAKCGKTELRSNGIQATLNILHSILDGNGLGAMNTRLAWDCADRDLDVGVHDEWLTLLIPELRKGSLDISVNEIGLIRISGGDGLYDGHFFNALFNPNEEKAKLLSLLNHEFVGDHFSRIVHLIAPEKAFILDWFFHKLQVFKKKSAEFGFNALKSYIPLPNISRIAASVLFEHGDYYQTMYELIDQAIHGHGVDTEKFEHIIYDSLKKNEEYSANADSMIIDIRRAIKVLAQFAEPNRFTPPEVTHDVALCEDITYVDDYGKLPKAEDFYTYSKNLKDNIPKYKVYAEYCAGLTLPQLDWFLSHDIVAKDSKLYRRFSDLASIKHKIANQFPQGGGYFLQDMSIDTFLATLIKLDEKDCAAKGIKDECVADIFRSLIAPEDMAILLSATLSSKSHGRVAALNLYRIIQRLAERGRDYVNAVFYEMSQGSSRLLVGILVSFIDFDLSVMRKPIDRAALLNQKLGLNVAPREAYLHGGPREKESFYSDNLKAALQILQSTRPYLASKQRLQSFRHPLNAHASTSIDTRIARKTLELADNIAQNCRFDGEQPEGPIEESIKAYETAYDVCRTLLAQSPSAFKYDWFKSFWSRTYESNLVHCVLKNYLEDVDNVRFWFRQRLGRTMEGESRQAMIRDIIHTLYYHKEDQERLLADPLIRLSLETPPGRVDFTVIGSMGIITNGRQGWELTQTFGRLERDRGIKLIRSDTGTICTLDYNARRIIDAIQSVKGPFGILGYSQGCANMLEAEQRLYSGTPEMQSCLDNLKARHFIYSAFNGSTHGNIGCEKMTETTINIEHFLKNYETRFSKSTLRAGFDLIKSLLDSPYITNMMESIESVNYEGLVALARDAQYKPDVICSSLRAVCTEDILPSCLKLLYYFYQIQLPGGLNDTQVTEFCAHGYPVWNRNDNVDVLRTNEIPTCTLNGHHWSPLVEDIEFIVTDNDRARALYDSPKDIHIVPWIESLIRFGIIQ